MPYAPSDGARLWFEEAGTGHPILFIHEFGADHREWEDQMRFFSREYRCIAYAARGYPPSDVPTDPKLYGQDFAVKDAVAVLRHLGIAQGAHRRAVHGRLRGDPLRHPPPGDGERASSRPARGRGRPRRGRPPSAPQCQEKGEALIARGWPGANAEETGHSPTRIQLKKKDPRGWAAYMERLFSTPVSAPG